MKEWCENTSSFSIDNFRLWSDELKNQDRIHN